MTAYQNTLEITDSDSDNVLWFKLNRTFCGLKEDVIFGVVYILPLQFRFYSEDEYMAFERDINDTLSKYKCVYLFGDFNSQTSDMPDYTEGDHFLFQLFD